MKKVFLVLILFLSSSPELWAQKGNYAPAIEKARSLLAEMQEKNKIPGISVTVMVKGQVVWSEGFGYADLEQQVKVDPSKTKFRVGSVSKTLTSSAMAKLYEAGKIDLDAPIQTYVPDFPPKRAPFSLRQLAGHLAGIRHYRGDEFMNPKNFETVREGLEFFEDDTLLFAPGSDYFYSSYGWNLISAAIEQAAGQDFLSFMQISVFDPLKMSQTLADHTDSLIANRSRFYIRLEDQSVLNAPFVDNSYKWAGGGFLSTTEDLARFAQAHTKAGYLMASTLDVWTQSMAKDNGEKTGYGLGWQMGEVEGHAWYGHSGVSLGSNTQMIIYPKEEVIVAILTNIGPLDFEDTHHKIAQTFINN